MSDLIHVVIVTGQPAPNLIPILQFKPNKVVLLYTNDMEASRLHFEELLLRTCHFNDEDIMWFSDLPNAKFDSLIEFATDVLLELRENFPDAEICLNATGGTKIMSLALHSVFDGQDKVQIIYTDTEHQTIEYLHNPLTVPYEKMQPVLDIETQLMINGKMLIKNNKADAISSAKDRSVLTNWLVKNVDQIEGFIPVLNNAVNSALTSRKGEHGHKVEELTHPKQTFKKIWGMAHSVLDKLQEYDLIDQDPNNSNTIIFKSKEACQYIRGGWLEEYSMRIASEIGFDEVGFSVQFTDLYNPSLHDLNEMDVVICHHNKVLMIECKTGQATREANKILYKLDSIGTNAGGTLTDKLLVSAITLDGDARRPNTSQRAKNMSIDTLQGKGIRQLSKYLKHWKRRLN